jgi:hypothetical protein
MLKIKAVLASVLVALFIISSFNTATIVLAGDINNPEVVDSEGDSVSGKTSQDILWGYMGHETNSTFAVVIGMKSLETFTDPTQIQSVPITEYEFYFTIHGVNYGARATVPVHGPFGIDIRWELFTVEYNGSTMPPKETSKGSLSTAKYDAATGIVNMTINKADVGGIAQGDEATNLWCGVYSKQRTSGINMSNPVLQDKAPDNGYGQDFVFLGNPGEKIYRLELRTSSPRSTNITAFETLNTELTVINNGSVANPITINYTVNSLGKNFTITFFPSSFTLEPNSEENVTMRIHIFNLRGVADKDTLTVNVWASTNAGNNTDPDIHTSNSLSFSITASIPTTPAPKKTGLAKTLEQISSNFKANKNLYLGGIGGLIALVIVLVIVRKLRTSRMKPVESEDLEIKGKKLTKEKDDQDEQEEEDQDEDEDDN